MASILLFHRLAKNVRKSQELPGYELFQYIDASGEKQSIESSDVNSYLAGKLPGKTLLSKIFAPGQRLPRRPERFKSSNRLILKRRLN